MPTRERLNHFTTTVDFFFFFIKSAMIIFFFFTDTLGARSVGIYTVLSRGLHNIIIIIIISLGRIRTYIMFVSIIHLVAKRATFFFSVHKSQSANKISAKKNRRSRMCAPVFYEYPPTPQPLPSASSSRLAVGIFFGGHCKIGSSSSSTTEDTWSKVRTRSKNRSCSRSQPFF